MSHDEVGHGNDPDLGRSYGWYLIIAVAVVVALVTMLGRHHPATKASPRPLPTLAPLVTSTPTGQPSPSASTDKPDTATLTSRALVPTGPAGTVRSAEICSPDRPTASTLAVSFVLLNPTAEKERIVLITPRLPMGGLRPTGVFVRTGTCKTGAGPPVKPAGVIIKPGKAVVVIMNFTLPDTCPQPLPVGANITVTGSLGPIVNSLPLFPDLGSVQFENCPTPSAD